MGGGGGFAQNQFCTTAAFDLAAASPPSGHPGNFKDAVTSWEIIGQIGDESEQPSLLLLPPPLKKNCKPACPREVHCVQSL